MADCFISPAFDSFSFSLFMVSPVMSCFASMSSAVSTNLKTVLTFFVLADLFSLVWIASHSGSVLATFRVSPFHSPFKYLTRSLFFLFE